MKKLTDESYMPFGSYQGSTMDEVPDSYLLYLWGQWREKPPKWPAQKLVQAYVKENLEAIQENVKRENSKKDARKSNA